MRHAVVRREEWVKKRLALLEKEKVLTKSRDALAREIRELPWVEVVKEYEFEGPDGRETLPDLFSDRSQLLVYHFMLGPDWDEGCPSCSFWADNFQGIPVHLKHRDVAFVAISRAPFDRIEEFRKRMGWSFKWVSSHGSDFNFDYGVSFTEKEIEAGQAVYNFRATPNVIEEMPGLSVFYREGDCVFHTYSAYSRGLDVVNGAYQYLDLVPKGRDEGDLDYTMAWLRHHDRY